MQIGSGFKRQGFPAQIISLCGGNDEDPKEPLSFATGLICIAIIGCGNKAEEEAAAAQGGSRKTLLRWLKQVASNAAQETREEDGAAQGDRRRAAGERGCR